jgi:putative transposase
MLLSIKTKLKLNKSQKQLMAKHAGILRFTYNWGLAAWKDLYESGLKPNKYIPKSSLIIMLNLNLLGLKKKVFVKK